MSKSLYLLIGFFFVFTATVAQNDEPIRKFGKLPIEELIPKYSEIDSSAAKEVLFDFAEVDFGYNDYQGLFIRTKIHRRIKIYNKSALDQGNFSIRVLEQSGTDRETVSGIKGITYNLVNGKMETESLDKKSIFYEKIQDGVSQHKVSMPNVKEGSVIEYTYEISSPISVRNKPKAWVFQGDSPVKWSELDITIPSHFYYQIIMGGYLPLYRNTREQVNVEMGFEKLNTTGLHYNFIVKDAPAFKDEKYVSADRDYVSMIEFELSSILLPGQPEKNFNTTWEELDRTLLNHEYWGGRFKPTREVKDIAAGFTSIKDPLERLTKIHSKISNDFKWDGYASIWAGENIRKLFDSKTGNASELNILLCTVLREAGLDANPVIISTRSNGRINLIYPLLDRFNYTIVAVGIGEETWFVDATDPLSMPGILPARCIVEDGRLIHINGGYFTKINANDSYSEMIKVVAKLHPEEGKISGEFNQSCAGLLAHELRTILAKNGKEDFIKSQKTTEDSWTYDNFELENFDSKNESTVIKYNFKIEEGGIMPDMIYMPSILTNALAENPLKRKSREFPVDFGHVINQTYTGIYIIPEGFEIEAMPESVSIALPGGSGRFLFATSVNEGQISVVSRIVFKKRTYPADEYPYLRELYAKIVEKHSEQIVLKQKQ